MDEVARVALIDGIGVVEIDRPPVNAMGVAVRRSLQTALRTLDADESVGAIVLLCAGRTFFAGADITEFGKPPEPPGLPELVEWIDSLATPVVAAIHGTALGGGLETALACHYRIAVPSARLGLPEVALGLLPGAGGTQRLPRLVGVETALDMITSGKPIGAERALALGLIDALAGEGRLRKEAIAFARAIVGKPVVRVRDRDDKVAPARGHPELYAAFRARNPRLFRGFKAPAAILTAIEAAAELPFEAGLARERALFATLHDSVESAAQRYYFFAERETARVPGITPATPVLPIHDVGVIGAGTMGGGIAMTFLDAGLPVTLVDTTQLALSRGLNVIRGHYAASVRKGRLSKAEVATRLARLKPVLGLEALAGADLVIEAAFEELAVKTDIFARLDAIARPGAILASNTSYLDIDRIAAATWRPERVCGLHFFSPANVMRLLEVVRGRETATEVVATAMRIARTIGKVPVLSRVGPGFIANRVMTTRGAQANALVLEGTDPQTIDRAITDYGFAMGPFAMMDLVGLDVIGRGVPGRTVAGDLVALGRLGQKRNGGYYDYDADRRATPSPVASQVIADVAAARGIARRAMIDDAAIIARLLYPVVNEGARVLAEGIALRPSDIDVACILGYNWPLHTGGPMFWADTIGLPRIVAALEAMQAAHGDAFRPARLLADKAARGESFTR